MWYRINEGQFCHKPPGLVIFAPYNAGFQLLRIYYPHYHLSSPLTPQLSPLYVINSVCFLP
ncbi:hypothetical protein EXN66_Car013048 [Channa argus]|uniref:Uncharacterized protein n=1 Tax=Channa argus TaxID=215402 RepID=A0A6G1Q526_CHAAH|nr:hypothetical protein EXN66_Car013048 [Channa argus]